MSINTHSFQLGNLEYVLETGKMARQADSAVKVTVGNTVILATLVYDKKNPDAKQDFFPLTVIYQERYSATGRFPGGFMKRETKPSDREVLISRLIDRPIRPLFHKNFTREVQIIITALSLDNSIESDIPAMIGAAACLALSGLPVHNTLAGVRVGLINDEFVVNPSAGDLKNSKLDLVVAGTKTAALMVESEAKELPEDKMLEAVFFGQEQLQVAIEAIEQFASKSEIKKLDWQPKEHNKDIVADITKKAAQDLQAAYSIVTKTERREAINKAREIALADVAEENLSEAQAVFASLEKKIVRQKVLSEKKRIDGRGTTDIRPIEVEVGVLPRTHGSALFTRGETQALVVATLGTEKDAQTIDNAFGEAKDQFLLHYNFPPFSVGEVGRLGPPKRRELGHGNLALRAIKPVMPSYSDFSYVIRLISEILESNGSSSMATVCGSSLALMDAGVPVKSPVAGIAMGLVKEENDFAILSDILGDEDHLGDMDFKVAGTSEGVTALQMDIKIEGITHEIMKVALEQAHAGRAHILGIMNKMIDKSRADISSYAPTITTIQIKPEKVREVIGKGGATIKSIIEATGVTMDITDDGTIKIASVEKEASDKAQQMIADIVAEPEIGKVYEGKVIKLMEFGAFVQFMPGQEGLVHISQICDKRVEKVSDELSEGQEVRIKVLEIDKQGRVRLTMKGIE